MIQDPDNKKKEIYENNAKATILKLVKSTYSSWRLIYEKHFESLQKNLENKC